jgi:hypothetical protein
VEKFSETSKVLLVGDNPFHNISHLSQERTRLRDKSTVLPERAADLIHLAVENGANGFMFSVSETTLSILKSLKEREMIEGLNLYGIVPYAYDYVKLATQVGGISGLAKKVGVRVVISRNLRMNVTGVIGFLKMDPLAIMKTYVAYEISRIRSAAGRNAKISCILLHEVVTDLALALNMESLFKAYVEFMGKQRIACGFNTCNFAYLINKLREWGIDPSKIVVAAPFNRAGFQMCPSREECEQVLKSLDKPLLVAISVLAAGYLKPREALEYIGTLPNVKGLALGVSKEAHAKETFKMAKNLTESKADFTE